MIMRRTNVYPFPAVCIRTSTERPEALDKLDAACEAGMKQIEDRDYTAILRRYRVKEIWIYAIAFWDKECCVAAKRVTA